MILITAICKYDNNNASLIWQSKTIFRYPKCSYLICIQPLRVSSLSLNQNFEVEDLTRRELEVLALIKIGLTNDEIADALIISERTVFTHVSSIFHKLGVSSRTSALYSAESLGIILAYKNQ